MGVGQLRQSLRILLLPMRAGSEGACGRALLRGFRRLGIAPSDFVKWVSLELGLWRDGGGASGEFAAIVESVLSAADARFGPTIGKKYFQIHRSLCDEHLMSHDEAIAFLSHAFLICDLADNESLSAAQVSRLIDRRDGRVGFSRQSIGTALRGLGIEPSLTLPQMKRLFDRDRSLELPGLADADLRTTAEFIGEIASGLGFSGGLKSSLELLAPDANPGVFAPYLQILHFQCSVAEYFDHAVTDLYEFRPRGQAAGWLFEQYPPALVTAGNPFLNNAKSVERLDEQWVRSKKPDQLPGAAALFDVLACMEEMGFATRRELARWIRLWLHRVIRLAAPIAITLPDVLSAESVANILESVRVGNSRTYGVLEQRVVDAVASLLHMETDGWRGRGLLDSVNATNISRRKLGDCDFQHAADFYIHAYEAHGGELTNVYVAEHARTLAKCIAARGGELSGIADLDNWDATVTFVAHKISADLPRTIEIEGLSVHLTATTFSDFVDAVPLIALTDSFNTYVLGALREQRTPEEVRRVVVSMAER